MENIRTELVGLALRPVSVSLPYKPKGRVPDSFLSGTLPLHVLLRSNDVICLL